MGFSGFETARGGIWRICAVIDYATKYCLAATVTPTSRGQDALGCLRRAVAGAERVLGLALLGWPGVGLHRRMSTRTSNYGCSPAQPVSSRCPYRSALRASAAAVPTTLCDQRRLGCAGPQPQRKHGHDGHRRHGSVQEHLPDLGQRPFCGQKLRQKPPGQAFTIYFDGPWLTLVHAGTSTDTSIFRWWPPRLLSPYLSRNACTTEATPFARHVG